MVPRASWSRETLPECPLQIQPLQRQGENRGILNPFVFKDFTQGPEGETLLLITFPRVSLGT